MTGKNISKYKLYISVAICVCVVLIIAIWGPESLAKYGDRATLNHITVMDSQDESEGYRYALSSNEKLYILSKCLDSKSVAESEFKTLTKAENHNMEYGNISGSYAFIVNRQGSPDTDSALEQIFEKCNKEIEELKGMGVIPRGTAELDKGRYSVESYSAIDILEPRNNMSVWKISLLTDTKNSDKANRIIDLYVDADSGKIYEFYVRGDVVWEDIDSDKVVESWSEYLGLTGMEEYTSVNPLLEATPYYEKYNFSYKEMSTTVTLGFYEGIDELYLKISR